MLWVLEMRRFINYVNRPPIAAANVGAAFAAHAATRIREDKPHVRIVTTYYMPSTELNWQILDEESRFPKQRLRFANFVNIFFFAASVTDRYTIIEQAYRRADTNRKPANTKLARLIAKAGFLCKPMRNHPFDKLLLLIEQ